MSSNYLLIDGSYYVFYRYYALINWWKMSHKGEDLEKPNENKEFVEKFKKTFVNKLYEIPKKLKIIDPKIYVAKDCKRKDIWRMKYFSKYKENRVYDDSFMGGEFFKMVYEEDMFLKNGVLNILKNNNLEADDCIAIATKYILEKDKDANIWIITSDMDYLQLVQDRVHIYSLKYKLLTDSKNSFNDAKKDLFYKIVLGDKSDGIPGVFKRCGKKMVEKCYNDKKYFKEKLIKEDSEKIYNMNRKIIDFDKIPNELILEFKNKLSQYIK